MTDFGRVQPHKTTHQDGGSDEISLGGLSGEAADDQPLKEHGTDKHDATISKKRLHYIPLGGYNHTSTSYLSMEVRGHKIDLSKFDLITAIYLQLNLHQNASGTYTVYAELYNATDSESIANSELSADLSQWGASYLKTPDLKDGLNLTAEKLYALRTKTESGGEVQPINSALVIEVEE